MKSYQLSEIELWAFRDEGIIGPIELYTEDEMQALWTSVRRKLLDRSHAPYDVSHLGSGPSIGNYDRHLDVPELADHICNPAIVNRVVSILGPDVVCWRSEFFPKNPGDEGTDWHQADTFAHASGKAQIVWPGESDLEFGKGALTVWTAFTSATIKNGCLQVIPGSHHKMNYDEYKQLTFNADQVNAVSKAGVLRGFYGYDYRKLQLDPTWTPNEYDACALVMRPGQCVIFWSTLMHASLPNTSNWPDRRMGFAARYVPASVLVYPETDVVEEYGGSISLDRYGAVLVAGKDRSGGRNRLATHTLRGQPFRSPRVVTDGDR